MANAFDQFDAPAQRAPAQTGGNPFDAFDEQPVAGLQTARPATARTPSSAERLLNPRLRQKIAGALDERHAALEQPDVSGLQQEQRAIEQESSALKAMRAEVKTQTDAEAFNQRVNALNQKVQGFQQRVQEFDSQAESYNADLQDIKSRYVKLAGADEVEGEAPGLVSNSLRNAGERGFDLLGNAIQFIGNAAEKGEEAITEKLGGFNPGVRLNRSQTLRDQGHEPDLEIGGYGVDFTTRLDPDETDTGLTAAGQAVGDVGLGYQPDYTIDKALDEPTLRNLAGAVAEQGPAALADMAALIVSTPAYLASRTQEIGEARVKNDGGDIRNASPELQAAIVDNFANGTPLPEDLQREADALAENGGMPELKEYLIAGPTAAASVLLDRFALGRILPGGGKAITSAKQVPGAVARGVATEAGTEAVQEGIIEYAGESVGTEAGWNPTQAGRRAAGGALVGGPTGGAVRAGTATYEAATAESRQGQDREALGEGMRMDAEPGQEGVNVTPGQTYGMNPFDQFDDAPAVRPSAASRAQADSVYDVNDEAETREARSGRESRDDQYPGVSEVVRDALPMQSEAVVPTRERVQGMGSELSGVSEGYGRAADTATYAGQDQQQRELRAGERSLGVDEDATEQQVQQPSDRIPGPEADNQPVGREGRDTSYSPEQATRGWNEPRTSDIGQIRQEGEAFSPQRENEVDISDRQRDGILRNKSVQESPRGSQSRRPAAEVQDVQAQRSGNVFVGNSPAQRPDSRVSSRTDISTGEIPAASIDEYIARETNTSPSEAQASQGNYKKARIKFRGLDIAIENPRGSTRSGTDPDGNRWESTMAHHYGDIKGTEAADGDNLDVFIGPYPEIDQVFVIDQPNADGSFDEHKVMLGFANEANAREGYLANYEDGWTAGPITRMSMDEFKAWMRDGDTTKPAAEPSTDQQTEPADTAPSQESEPESGRADQQTEQPTQPIEDFGERIEGARKDYASKLQDAKERDVSAVPLSKSWPEPNYQKMLDEGVPAETVALVRALRDEVPTKPQKAWKLRGWTEMVTGLRDMASTLMENQDMASQVIEQIRAMKASNRTAREAKHILGRMDLYQELGHENSFKGVTFEESFYQMYMGENNVTIWEVERLSKATAFGNMPRTLATGKTREEALDNLRKALDQIPESTKAGKAVRFNIYRDRYSNEVFIGKKIGKDVVRLKVFDDDVKAARKYLEENQQELEAQLEKMKQIPDHRRKSNSPRVGVDHRKGGDVTPEAFAETFGFRGVQFGNYVEQGRRQADLNEAYDALMDLAGILDIPAKAISLNGELGLAFGARGKGGKNAHAAHYEPGQIVINLTKKSGAGSLAHEWWHALDNYFGRGTDRKPRDAFASGGQPASDVRPEMVDAFSNIRQTVNRIRMKERSKALDKVRTKAYWSTDIEMSARAFESYVIERLKDQNASNDYLANIVSEDYWKASEALGMEQSDSYPYPEAAEVPEIRAAYDHFFQTIETRESGDGNIMFFSRGGDRPRNPLPEPQVRRTVENFFRRYKGADDVNIEYHATAETLPGYDAERDAGAVIAGQYDGRTDTIHLVVSAYDSQSAVREALQEEILVHKGLGFFRPEDRQQLYRDIQQAAQESQEVADLWERTVRDYQDVAESANLNEEQANRYYAEELLGSLAQKKINWLQRGWRTLRRGIKRLLVKAGWVRDSIGVDELRSRIELVAEAFERGRRAPRRDFSQDVVGDTQQEAAAPLPEVEETTDDAETQRILDRYVQGQSPQKVRGRSLGGGQAREGWQEQTKIRDGDRPGFVFRGSAQELTAGDFNAERRGYATGHPSAALGTFFTNSDRDAQRYGSVRPYHLDLRNPYVIEGDALPSFDSPRDAANYRAELETQGYDGIVIDYTHLDGPQHIVPFEAESVVVPDNIPMFSRTGDGIPTLDPDPFGPPSDTIVRRAVSKIADKFTVLKGVQEQIKKAEGQIPEQADAYMAEELFHGKVENDIRLVRERMIEPLTEKMAEYDISLKQLDQFLYALHAPERNRVIAERNPQMPDGGSGMTNAEAAEIVRKAKESGKLSEYRDLATRVHRMLEMRRNILRSAGLLDEDTLGAWEASYRAYVPLKGFAADEAPDGRPRSGKGFAIAGKESQLAGGRRSRAASPVANSISDLSEAVLRHRKNEVGQSFMNLVQMYPNDGYWRIYSDENPEVERKPVRVKDPATGKMKVEVREQTVPMAMMSDRYFTTKVDGKTHYIKIEDERLMNAMRNVGPDNNNILVRSLAAVTRVMSSLNTSYNPEFVISNFSRDIQTALLNLTSEQSSEDGKARGTKIAAKTLKDVGTSIRAINASLKGKTLTGKAGQWQKHFDQFRADGAKTGWFDMKDVDGQMRDMEKLVKLAQGGTVSNLRKTFRNVTDWVEHTNGAIENGVRLSAYVNAIEAGIPRKQAASLAKNMTVNFNRRGEWGTTMNAVYMFANASVQGTNNFVRTLGRLNGHKGDRIWRRMNTAQKIAAGMAVGGFMLSLLNRLGAGEDDDGVNWWDKVPDYIKERNIVLMKSLVGGEPGEYWTIPLPYGYNIFPVIGTQAEHLAFSENQSAGQAASNTILAALGSFSPIGFEESNEAYGTVIKNVTPTILRPIASISLNENFMGGPIFKENFPFGTPKPDSSLHFRSTPEAFKILAENINKATGGNEQMSGAADWSPDVMNYLVAYYGGGAYDFFTSRTPNFVTKLTTGVELEDREIPFWRKIHGKVLPYEDQSIFYDRRDEINQLVERREALKPGERGAFVREYRDKLRLKPIMDATEKRLRRLRKQRDRIEMRDDLSMAEKDQRLQDVEARIKREIDRFNERYNEADD